MQIIQSRIENTIAKPHKSHKISRSFFSAYESHSFSSKFSATLVVFWVFVSVFGGIGGVSRAVKEQFWKYITLLTNWTDIDFLNKLSLLDVPLHFQINIPLNFGKILKSTVCLTLNKLKKAYTSSFKSF